MSTLLRSPRSRWIAFAVAGIALVAAVSVWAYADRAGDGSSRSAELEALDGVGGAGSGEVANGPDGSGDAGQAELPAAGTEPGGVAGEGGSAAAAAAERLAASSTPASPGEELERVTTPPSETLWALSPDSYDAGVEMELIFEPYGLGPEALGPSVVVVVRTLTLTGSTSGARVPEMEDRNVILLLGPGVTVDMGGRYVADVVTQAREERIVMVIEGVDRISEP